MSEKLINFTITDVLEEQLKLAIDRQQKKTGIKISTSDFIRVAISEKILRIK